MRPLTCRVCGKGPFASGRAVSGHENWCVKRTPEFAAKRLMAMRLDLLRVARMQGVPDGYAPSQLAYREHGQYSEKLIIGWFGGYTPAGNPRGTWREAVAKLGFKMYGDYYHANLSRIATDIRRVALAIGRPLHIPPRSIYKRLGRWDPVTVYLHTRTKNWGEVARALQLKTNANFGNRKVTDAQRAEIRARYPHRKRGDVVRMAREFGITATQIRRIAQSAPEAQMRAA